jgi:hypothetical protein
LNAVKYRDDILGRSMALFKDWPYHRLFYGQCPQPFSYSSGVE